MKNVITLSLLCNVEYNEEKTQYSRINEKLSTLNYKLFYDLHTAFSCISEFACCVNFVSTRRVFGVLFCVSPTVCYTFVVLARRLVLPV